MTDEEQRNTAKERPADMINNSNLGTWMSWDRIVNNYPDKWVALCDYNIEGTRILKARVVAVCANGDRLEKEKELVGRNISFIWRWTTDIEGALVL